MQTCPSGRELPDYKLVVLLVAELGLMDSEKLPFAVGIAVPVSASVIAVRMR